MMTEFVISQPREFHILRDIIDGSLLPDGIVLPLALLSTIGHKEIDLKLQIERFCEEREIVVTFTDTSARFQKGEFLA